MEPHMTLALEIVTAQAKVRIMDQEEIRSLAASLTAAIRGMAETPGARENCPAGTSASAKKGRQGTHHHLSGIGQVV